MGLPRNFHFISLYRNPFNIPYITDYCSYNYFEKFMSIIIPSKERKDAPFYASVIDRSCAAWKKSLQSLQMA